MNENSYLNHSQLEEAWEWTGCAANHLNGTDWSKFAEIDVPIDS